MFSIENFKNFFIGSYHQIGNQYGKGKWVSGKIQKATLGKCKTIEEAIQLHLMQEITMGSYPFYKKNNIWYCKYICLDIDSHDHKSLFAIYKKLAPFTLLIMRYLIIEYSIPANCILREFSGEGFHIWIKLKPFTTLKRAFDFKIFLHSKLKEKFNLQCEIFPKQDENIKLAKKFGNCCKVPLSLNRKNGRFCKILDNFDLSQQGLGYNIPNWIPKRPKIPIVNKKAQNFKSIAPIKIKHNSEIDNFLPNLRPCMKAVILGKVQTHNHPSSNGHYFNIMICNTLYYLGATRKVRISAFKNQPDFSFSISEKQVISLEKNFNPAYVKHLSCKTIRKKGFCIPNCHFKN